MVRVVQCLLLHLSLIALLCGFTCALGMVGRPSHSVGGACVALACACYQVWALARGVAQAVAVEESGCEA